MFAPLTILGRLRWPTSTDGCLTLQVASAGVFWRLERRAEPSNGSCSSLLKFSVRRLMARPTCLVTRHGPSLALADSSEGVRSAARAHCDPGLMPGVHSAGVLRLGRDRAADRGFLCDPLAGAQLDAGPELVVGQVRAMVKSFELRRRLDYRAVEQVESEEADLLRAGRGVVVVDGCLEVFVACQHDAAGFLPTRTFDASATTGSCRPWQQRLSHLTSQRVSVWSKSRMTRMGSIGLTKYFITAALSTMPGPGFSQRRASVCSLGTLASIGSTLSGQTRGFLLPGSGGRVPSVRPRTSSLQPFVRRRWRWPISRATRSRLQVLVPAGRAMRSGVTQTPRVQDLEMRYPTMLCLTPPLVSTGIRRAWSTSTRSAGLLWSWSGRASMEDWKALRGSTRRPPAGKLSRQVRAAAR